MAHGRDRQARQLPLSKIRPSASRHLGEIQNEFPTQGVRGSTTKRVLKHLIAKPASHCDNNHRAAHDEWTKTQPHGHLGDARRTTKSYLFSTCGSATLRKTLVT